MDRLVYTALSGIQGRLAAQAAIANNLANASTVGFKADKFDFAGLTLVDGKGLLSRSPTSEGVIDSDRAPGPIESTGRNLDVAINGDAWLAVQGADGQEAYTRRGDLTVSPTGVLVTGDGTPVMGASGSPITIPDNDGIQIAPDGTVSIVQQGGKADQPTAVDQLKLVSPKGSTTVKGQDNLLHVKGGGALPQDLDATVRTGALEGSNVNTTQALVDMIENQRSYEVEAKMLSTTKDLDEGGTSVMRMQD